MFGRSIYDDLYINSSYHVQIVRSIEWMDARLVLHAHFHITSSVGSPGFLSPAVTRLAPLDVT